MKLLLNLFIFTLYISYTSCQEIKSSGGAILNFEKNQIVLDNKQKNVLDEFNNMIKKDSINLNNYKLVLVNSYSKKEFKKDNLIGTKRCIQVSNYFFEKYNYSKDFILMQISNPNFNESDLSCIFFYLISIEN